MADFDMAIKLKPDYLNAKLNRAICWSHLGDAKQALAFAMQMMDTNPEYEDSYHLGQSCYFRLGWYSDAIELSERILARWPDSAHCRHNRACAFVALGEMEKALDEVETSIRLEPTRRKEVLEDEDLRPLHFHPRWVALLV